MILLQRYGDPPKLGREEQAVYIYATMERMPVRYFMSGDLAMLNICDYDLIVGSVESCQAALTQLGLPVVEPNYYPLELGHLLGRSVREGVLQDVYQIVNHGSTVFAKPKKEFKSFTGSVFTSDNIHSLDDRHRHESVWISDVVSFRSEARCYVLDNQLLACCQYAGDIDELPNRKVIEEAMHLLKQSQNHPNTYCIDFGVTFTGETLLVELGEGFAVGRYKGITERDYFRFLYGRWKELTSKHKP